MPTVLKCLPSLKSLQLAQFLIFFQKSGSYVKLRTPTMEIDRFRVVTGTLEARHYATLFDIIFSPKTYNPDTRSRSWPKSSELHFINSTRAAVGNWKVSARTMLVRLRNSMIQRAHRLPAHRTKLHWYLVVFYRSASQVIHFGLVGNM